jgi:hypothetical protein
MRIDIAGRRMPSLVTDLQKNILNSKKSVTEILRTAKLHRLIRRRSLLLSSIVGVFQVEVV